MSLKKLKFIVKLSFFPLRNGLKKVGINYNIEKIINNYYKEKFKKITNNRAIFLPHCLIHNNCPAKFSKTDGIMCIKCGLCKCGDIKVTAEEKGFQFFIVPSVEFIKRIIKRKNIQAVLGVTCIHDIIEGLKQEKLNPKGLFLNGKKIVPIVIQLPKYDCVNNDVDWELVKKQINEL
jgi:uncharacterized protein